MPATRAGGAATKLAIKSQGSFGAKAAGNYVFVPFSSFDLSAQDQVNTDQILGQGRQSQRPARDVIDVRGKVRVPADTEALGWWLYGLLGAPATTGAGPYQHVFTSAQGTLPWFTIEAQHLDVSPAIYRTYRDVMVDGMTLEFSPTGRASVEFDLIATTEEEDGTSDAGTPTTPALNWFHQSVNSIKKDGVAVAKIPSFSMTYANNIEADRYIGGGGLIGSLEPGIATGGGTLRARFSDSTLRSLAVAGTVFDLELGWIISATQRVLFEFDAAELLRRETSVDGPAGITRNFQVVASQDASEGTLLRVTLNNATSGYS